MASTPSTTRPRAAFTLIELLVVGAVIGILAALLLPVLARGKAVAQRTSCINRHKQWNVALMLYAHDNEDTIPRESFIPNGTSINLWAQVQNPLAFNVWYNALPLLIDTSPASSYAPKAVRFDFYDRSRLIHCPAAAFPPREEMNPSITYFSLAMNSKLILEPYSTMQFSTIQSPAATVTFLDGRLPGEPKVDSLQEDDQLGQPSVFANRFVARHLGRGTLAFSDGHVECLAGAEVVHEGTDIYPPKNVIWTADPAINP